MRGAAALKKGFVSLPLDWDEVLREATVLARKDRGALNRDLYVISVALVLHSYKHRPQDVQDRAVLAFVSCFGDTKHKVEMEFADFVSPPCKHKVVVVRSKARG